MSFILDALKKSESDRQRQSGPALFEVKVAPPKPRFPYWAVALAALLVINIAVGAWVFLRRSQTDPVETTQPAAAALKSAATAALPQALAPATVAAAAPAAGNSPPAAASTAAPPPAQTTPSAAERGGPVLSGTEQPKDTPVNPDDYAPAVEPARAAPDQAGSHVRSGTESGFKSYAEAASTPESHMPQLRIDLHVYATNPQERFILINMHRLHEGDTLPEGVKVDSITPEGAVVSYQGSKFILERE